MWHLALSTFTGQNIPSSLKLIFDGRAKYHGKYSNTSATRDNIFCGLQVTQLPLRYSPSCTTAGVKNGFLQALFPG